MSLCSHLQFDELQALEQLPGEGGEGVLRQVAMETQKQKQRSEVITHQ